MFCSMYPDKLEDVAFLPEIKDLQAVQKELRDVEALWVDKYSPQRYTELLSDEVSQSCM